MGKDGKMASSSLNEKIICKGYFPQKRDKKWIRGRRVGEAAGRYGKLASSSLIVGIADEAF